MKTIHCVGINEIKIVKSGENIHIETPYFSIAVNRDAAKKLVDAILPILNENASPDLTAKFQKQFDEFLADRKK